MRILNKISVVGVLLAAVFYLGSCGGGGGTSAGSNPVANVLTGTFTTTNIASGVAASGIVYPIAHIHDEVVVGVPGPVVIPLTQSAPGTWTVPATVLNDTQIARLRAGGYYVNVHTVLNPSGEIRGQLVVSSTNPNMFTATLDLAQEVPAPNVPAGAVPTGSGSVILTTAAGAPY